MFREFKAYLDDYSLITVEMPIEFDQKGMHFFLSLPEYGNTPLTVSGYEVKESYINYYLIPHHELAIGEAYEVIDHRGNRSVLRMREIVRTVRFDEEYFYEGNDLGVTYEKSKTTLKLWAPTATEVYAVVSKSNNTQVLPMNREVKGVFSASLMGDYEGYMYHYLTCLDGKWHQTIDPYARASSANGKDNYIIDTSKIMKINSFLEKRNPLNHFTDAIIYEIHIRDFTVQPEAGFRNRAKFVGMTENIEKNGEKLGFEYLKNMGVTHVQLLPFYDFGSVDELDQFQLYNWGYDPVQYNVPEGSYASNPNDPYARLIELKEMISQFHQAGMRINMDVVYNHVYNHKTHAFEKTVPGYFFRYDHHGQMSNGTFCGNDIASERQMVRKYIVDSVRYWVEQFGIDGFRFDLMGILDVETMNEIRKTLTAIDPTIMLYGEGWNMPTSLIESQKAHMFNSKEMPLIGHFNDVFRDSLKGDTIRKDENQQTGIVTGSNRFNKNMPDLLTASLGIYGQVNLFKEPSECINYVECHDNHTMWDFFQIEYPTGHTVMLQEIHRLATSLTLLSQGIAFLHGGQEFFRTKKGVENSYNVDDSINQFDWSRMIQYKENVEYIRGLIALRKLHGALHFADKALIKKHCRIEMLTNGMTLYEIEQVGEYGPWENIFMVINTTSEMLHFEVDEPGWSLYVNEQCAGTTAIKENVSKVYIAPYSIVLLAQSKSSE
ncbi:MAG: type I pullulanase [Culicoidibacterales bacterium]